ncbi:YczE/YyaS/YitT family protein [Kineococcus sp. SYSU DK018]|uniref:YczE/YyaS/YitT family protein n=1 Tax=Kineococcus sp. SYSU DK018 TaxID=3383139 RepID=UPI003D7D21E9
MSSRRADRTPPPDPSGRRRRLPPPHRVVQFLAGLALCAAGVWGSLQVQLGVASWDVLHAGIAGRTGLSYGTVVAAVGVLVVLVSLALGVRPRLGTLVNVVAIAVTLDALLASTWLDGLHAAPLPVRVVVLMASVLSLGFGGALYIGAGLGSGPRDSLMVACHLRGLPVGASRAVIEVGVVALGWLLGGPVGVGTVVAALALGPVTQVAFRVLRQSPAAGT